MGIVQDELLESMGKVFRGNCFSFNSWLFYNEDKNTATAIFFFLP